ncbi:hypothetical protein [Embleya sp. NPDC001921]
MGTKATSDPAAMDAIQQRSTGRRRIDGPVRGERVVQERIAVIRATVAAPSDSGRGILRRSPPLRLTPERHTSRRFVLIQFISIRFIKMRFIQICFVAAGFISPKTLPF